MNPVVNTSRRMAVRSAAALAARSSLTRAGAAGTRRVNTAASAVHANRVCRPFLRCEQKLAFA